MLKVLVLGLAAIASSASVRQSTRNCGTRDYIPELDDSTEEAIAQAIADGSAEDIVSFPVTVSVNFHVVSAGESVYHSNKGRVW